MVGLHHWLDEHESDQTSGDSEGEGGLVCCSPWGWKEPDTKLATKQQQHENDYRGTWHLRTFRILCWLLCQVGYSNLLLLASTVCGTSSRISLPGQGRDWWPASLVALEVKNPPASAGRCKRHRFDPGVRKIPWRRTWQRTPAFLPGERNLVTKSWIWLKQLSTHTGTSGTWCVFPRHIVLSRGLDLATKIIPQWSMARER